MKKIIVPVFIFMMFFSLAAEKNKKLQLGFESEILAYNNIVLGEGGDADKYHTVSFLFGSPRMGLNIGFFLDNTSILGANIGFGYFHAEKYEDGWGNNGKSREVSFKLMPYYEYLFDNTSIVKPFFKIGFIINLISTGDYEVRKEVAWMLGGMAAGGAHIFIADSFSIDLGGMFQAIGGQDKYKNTDINIMNSEQKQRIITVALFFGLTGWI